MSLYRCLHVYSIVCVILTCESTNLLDVIPTVSKCCSKDEQLPLSLKTCVQYDDSENFTGNASTYPWWLPEDVYFLSSRNMEPLHLYPEEHSHKLGVHYGRTLPCESPEIIPFLDSVAFLDDGSLVIEKGSFNWTFPSTSYCADRVTFDSQMLDQDHSFVILLCPCQHATCCRKCCRNGMAVEVQAINGTQQAHCVKRDTPFRNDTGNRFFTVHGFPNCSGSVYKETVTAYQVLEDGGLQTRGVIIPSYEYCMDFVHDGVLVESILACVQPPVNKTKTLLYGIFFCTGSVFLIATLLVHLILPELRRKMPSFNLMSHVACLLVGYVCMALVDFSSGVLRSVPCIILAYLIQFSFLAAFFWLSVMCIDISWTFSGLRVPQGNTVLNSDSKKFVYYSVYAWGSTSLIVLITAVLEFVPGIPQTKFTPNFGKQRCWFKDSEAVLLLFYGPMAILLFGNLLLFIYTAVKIMIARRNTAILTNEGSYRYEGRNHAEDKHRFTLYLKLFCLTGLTWVFEIVSWVIQGPDSIWYATDIINVLRGVFIFIIFCCKKKVYTLLKAKFCKHKVNNNNSSSNRIHRSSITPSSRETSSSQRTNSFQLSQVIDNTE